jgi:NADH:ubiquinone reductase (H+-translocating)
MSRANGIATGGDGGERGCGHPRVVVVGGGFAGFHAAKSLGRRLGGAAEVVLVAPTDYFLYLPLLPEVAAGILEPRRITVSLAATLPGVRLVLGNVDRIDVESREVSLVNPEGERHDLGYDRLVLAAGSVNKLLPVPGVPEHAHGFRGVPEAIYLRDHLVRQVELAAGTDDPAECRARCTVVVVGAGYTGTEVAAHGKLFTDALARVHPSLGPHPVRWMLLDLAPRVLPGLDEHLARTADSVLRERGVDVQMGVSIDEATREGVRLTTGEEVGTRTIVWCVGVRPDPLIESLGLPTQQGRLTVGENLTVPGHPEIVACGDAAAVPDRTRPGQLTAMTAQHAVRQGTLAGRNVAASLRGKRLRRYRHHDLGFVVDLGGSDAAANPLGLRLSGLLAKVVTRGYHLLSMPGNRLRIAVDWALDAVQSRQSVQLGLLRSPEVPLDTATPELTRHAVPVAREHP